MVIPAALTLIFVILVMTFGSVVQAGIIFLNIPFALVGGIFALGISGEYLSVPASVGFIALLGIAVLNGVVMVTHFNERLMEGEDLATVVRRGTGSEIQRPLAIVVTGGLVTSTLLTLLLLPKIFERFGSALSLRDTLRLMRQSTARQGENT